jgi:hypothetical protein
MITKFWRDVLPIHFAAELFPRMLPDELRALGEDMRDVSKLDTSIDTRGRKQPVRKGWSPERGEKHRAQKLRRAAIPPPAAEGSVVETAPISNTAKTIGGGEAPDLTRVQRVGAELARYAESDDVKANTYSALLDAWCRASADDRGRFLRFIGAQFVNDVARPAELKADTLADIG